MFICMQSYIQINLSITQTSYSIIKICTYNFVIKLWRQVLCRLSKVQSYLRVLFVCIVHLKCWLKVWFILRRSNNAILLKNGVCTRRWTRPRKLWVYGKLRLTSTVLVTMNVVKHIRDAKSIDKEIAFKVADQKNYQPVIF